MAWYGRVYPYLTTTPYVVRHKAEIAIRRDKAEDSVTLPLLVPHTGVEGDIIKDRLQCL